MIPGVELPDITHSKKILAVQPHYDDNDIGAGGTLYQLAQCGAEVIYLTVTDDLAGIIPAKDGSPLSKFEAITLIRENQAEAAKLIGVQNQIRLDFPDARNYDYFLLRNQIIQIIRQEQPDLLFSVDPWSPYEAHHDHIMAGKACAEAAILYDLPNIGEYHPEKMNHYALNGVVFYNTAYPNLIFDITESIHAKQSALAAYTAQFSQAAIEELIQKTTFLASYIAQEKEFKYGEALKVLAPWMLHGVPLTKML